MEERIPSCDELLAKARLALRDKKLRAIVEETRSPNAANDIAESRRFKREKVLSCHALARIKKYYPEKYEELKQKRIKLVQKKVGAPVTVPTPPKHNWRKWIYIGVSAIVLIGLLAGGLTMRTGDQKTSEPVVEQAVVPPAEQVVTPSVEQTENLPQATNLVSLSELRNDGGLGYISVRDSNGHLLMDFEGFLVKGQTIQIEISTYGKVKNGVTVALKGEKSGIEKKIVSGLMINKVKEKDTLEETVSLEIPRDVPIAIVENGKEVRERFELYIYNSSFSSLEEVVNFCEQNGLFSVETVVNSGYFGNEQYHKEKGVCKDDLYTKPFSISANDRSMFKFYLLEREEDRPEIRVLSPRSFKELGYGEVVPVEITCQNINGKIRMEIREYEFPKPPSGSDQIYIPDLPKPVIAYKALGLENGKTVTVEIKDYTSYLMNGKMYEISFQGMDIYGMEVETWVIISLVKKI